MGNLSTCCGPPEEKKQELIKVPVRKGMEEEHEEAEEVLPKGFTISFLDQTGKEVDVTFTEQPLGFKLVKTQVPLTVSGILDEGCVKAKHLHVEAGWTIKAVNGMDLANNVDDALDQFLSSLKKSFS
ncbi:Protein PyrBI [Durusdinium trenchii]|uniref:Protein PyrBI n=1 Tax=Durusdinium trenchii TaxID=1381693 RepID=A0ABP0K786_9DINO